MLVKRFADAKPYEAPNHRGVVGLRLQGFEEGGPTNQWVGLSQYLPGGGAGPDSTPFEKVYVVLDGEMTVIVEIRCRNNSLSIEAAVSPPPMTATRSAVACSSVPLGRIFRLRRRSNS